MRVLTIKITILMKERKDIVEYLGNDFSHKIIKCPKCGSNIEINEGYVQWCEYCKWNLRPSKEETGKDNILASIYKRIGKRLGEELFQSMLKLSTLKPKITISKILAFIISCVIFSISILSMALLVYCLTNFSINVLTVFICLFLFGFSVAAFPRFQKVPKKIVSRSDFPTLYKLVDSITKATNSKEVYGIVIDEDYNAAYTEVGLKRRKIVYIGLPLFHILNDDEKVALLSHEIAHGVNGDITRRLITCTALRTLITWYKIFSPAGTLNKSIVTIISNLIMLFLSKIILLFINILVHLIYNDSQRAEYLADSIGASISGTDAMKSLLSKLHLGNTFHIALHKAALSKGEINFFHELLLEVKLIPKKELERIKLIEKMDGSSLDATHPPAVNRISFMEQYGYFSPKVLLSETDSLLIQKEMELIKDDIERKIINNYIENLYY